MDKQIAVSEIINFLDYNVIHVFGNTENMYIKHLKPSQAVDENTLDWINSVKTDKQFIAESSKAKVILVDEEVKYTKKIQEQNKVLITVSNPKLCLLKIGNTFFMKKPDAGINSSAYIHPLARIGENVYIGANASIGACDIGDNVIINPNVVINEDVRIGSQVIIKSGAVIGFDGFGYERDETNNFVKFPQLGKLIIMDNVEIGSNTCIDKGALSDTIIGFNTKINNLCHIAHNVVIGKNVIITAHVNISGSTIIEDDVWIAPNASLRGQQKIGKGAVIGMGAVVTKDVPPGEIWVGNPAIKLKKG
jgi:UDP-3-O-[3-hydroxymyristoyl] glucosamine N-acyltransferase